MDEMDYINLYEEDENMTHYEIGDIRECGCPTCGTRMVNNDGLFWCDRCQAMYSEQDIVDYFNGDL